MQRLPLATGLAALLTTTTLALAAPGATGSTGHAAAFSRMGQDRTAALELVRAQADAFAISGPASVALGEVRTASDLLARAAPDRAEALLRHARDALDEARQPILRDVLLTTAGDATTPRGADLLTDTAYFAVAKTEEVSEVVTAAPAVPKSGMMMRMPGTEFSEGAPAMGQHMATAPEDLLDESDLGGQIEVTALVTLLPRDATMTGIDTAIGQIAAEDFDAARHTLDDISQGLILARLSDRQMLGDGQGTAAN